MKPFLKWAGGKTQILPTLFNYFPTEINNYHEIFIGGGSVLFHLLDAKAIKGNIYAYDINKSLIYVYKNLQTDYKTVIFKVNELIKTYNKLEGNDVNRKPDLEASTKSKENYFYYIRSVYNKTDSVTLDCSAMFIFLNKSCFRGLYRTGPNGFNVPYGNYKKIEEMDIPFSNLFKNVIFECLPFEESLKRVKPGDFVYLDPPYVPENKKSFVGYSAKGFGESQHKLLFKLINELPPKGIDFVLSNSDVDLVKDSFVDYSRQVISCKRSINSKNPESKTNEIIISSKYFIHSKPND